MGKVTSKSANNNKLPSFRECVNTNINVCSIVTHLSSMVFLSVTDGRDNKGLFVMMIMIMTMVTTITVRI